MSHNVYTVESGSCVQEAAKLMSDKNIGSVIVASGGRILGILTERDLSDKIVAENKNPSEVKAGDVMKSPVVTVNPDTTISEASRIMSEGGFRRLPIVEDGRIAGIITQRDVEGVLSREIQESEERYRHIIESVTDYIYTVVVEGGRPVETIHGHASVAVTGYTADEFMENPYLWIQMVPEEERESVREYSSRIVSGEIVKPLEHRIVRKDGRIRWIRNTAVQHLDGGGNIISYDGLVQDITERKAAEELTRMVINCSSIPLFVIDGRHRVMFWNNAMEELTGLKKGDIIGTCNHWMPFYGEYHPTLADVLVDGDVGRIPALYENHSKSKLIQGAYHAEGWRMKGAKYLSFTAAPIRDPQDGLMAVIETIEDFTELREKEDKIQEYTEKLEERVVERTKQLEVEKNRVQELLDTKTQFVNQLSHDLRTPLTPLISILPDLKTKLDGEEDRRLFEIAMKNIYYMRDLVVSTLDLARLDSGSVKFNMRPMSLREVVEEVITNNEKAFRDTNIRFVDRIPEGIPAVVADRLRIVEVFNNIVNNSLKFMPEGGNISFQAVVREGKVEVSVSDGGIGVEKDKIKFLFSEFYQVDSSRHNHSAGLGLAICKRIIEKHGGMIWVESDGLGKGLTVKFTLPM
ncbi:MAG: CBS domain-containing protein [Candidatus Altiarchaeota archaeon]